MGIRSLVLFSFAAAALSLASSSRADVPNPTGTGGSSSSSSTSGTGGAYDPNCTVAEESVAGSTCVECDPTGSSCGALDSSYNLVCQSAADKAVYCNGPIRNAPSDQNVAACAVSLPGGALGGLGAGVALAVAAAALRIRRRRS